MQKITVIGAGLAGSEAAWQLAKRGVKVDLYEMRPTKFTPAHHTDLCAELVCSNSLRAAGLENAVGLLKEEMRRLDSLVMSAADHTAVPAGGALAVDRNLFSAEITRRLEEHPNVAIHREEVHALPQDAITIVASGPLTSDDLARDILRVTGEEALSFYDAAAPIVTYESIDLDKAFWASRYDKGEADYLNCPLSKEDYELFYQELINAETAEIQGFEQGDVFEGCLPIEVMAKRGIQTLTFGPLKPVGLQDPRTGKKPFAVVQLRKENQSGTLFNLVGFQTHLKWGEQKRVFSLIPGLERAEFARFGVMHRNTFLNAPKVLKADFSFTGRPSLFFAGQMTGVEGYVESAASGLLAGLNAWRKTQQLDPLVFPAETTLGGLARHLEGSSSQSFQPMNINFGLLPPLQERIRDKRLKNTKISQRSLAVLSEFCSLENLGG
ncbi:methylenetetrahydrofolate--tRNA-(uracil(54)-C(5))-methyltransferase (FADH(2)-oxidizing) TrmFO [Desulfosporosinus sp. PR]|uniref:methylenetetrahydrofolate--tRNA-(uracil(54)- C(5))-methyltransferase (FADH(2)-oxidizing) TrmFO n=1 Tax=Candidatus Desulfosporosinus nitrosoreducens TaxID=3401928 RepID=UPI0027F67AE9|nr:methylenetetrahydrofolate--tRNA-(uracil(54)-C(5))-methyltransferase (FADH(2)-oxidizing) TrmFO [Desulfosporosinus sp. PR]MDQ7093356.1 methylenetetrahydrofolate--tRNA-(uracil(54)-C(5))-methyltransferase (FADH(2)-oxidizing) TrmFO [Desulfosporosinus sp. PR]